MANTPDWLSTRWLAHELIRADSHVAWARDNGLFNHILRLEEYREQIRILRSDLMRKRPVPDMSRCPQCGRLIRHEYVATAVRCPFCHEIAEPDPWEPDEADEEVEVGIP